MDASGSPSTGLYWGNTYWLGSRRQCLASTSSKRVPVSRTVGSYTEETKDSLPPFAIHYYAAYVRHDSTLQVFVHWSNEVVITLGLCLPTSCTEREVSGLLQEYFDSGNLAHQYVYNMTLKVEEVKKTEDDYAWTKLKIFRIFIISAITIVVLCILGTIYDVAFYQPSIRKYEKFLSNFDDRLLSNGTENNGQIVRKIIKHPEGSEYFLMKFIKCFSVSSNSKLIFDTSITTEEGKMLSIYGIRSLTIFWIVMNHGVLYTADYYYNRTAAYFISDHLVLQAFSNSSFSVDSFFCISGFLLGYGFLEMEKQKAKAGIKESPMKKILFIIVGIIDRIFRLLPPYLAAIGFAYTTSAIRHRQTAFWTSERNDLTCATYWWRNLLFINNLFSKEDICMNWSWYLSSDMQNFILCIILLVLATYYLKPAIYTLIGIFVLANLYTGYAAYSIGYVPFIDNVWSYYEVVYVRPWTRFGPNLIGLAGGCILQYYKRKLPFNKLTISLFWLAGLSAGMTMMFGFADKDMSLVGSAVYMTLGRSVWALSVMWLLLACLSGYAGFINSILSHPVWIPMGRLSYCVYLINPMVIKTLGSYTDSTWEVGIQTALLNGIGYVVLSFIIAFVFSLLFESPFFKLKKLFLGDIKQNANIKNSNANVKKEL